MKLRLNLSLTLLMVLFTIANVKAQNFTPGSPDSRFAQSRLVGENMKSHQTPVFIQNNGQWDNSARYLLKSEGLNFWVTNTESFMICIIT